MGTTTATLTETPCPPRLRPIIPTGCATMLNAIIRFSLHNRWLVLGVSVGVLVLGALAARSLPIDVLPDLTRPRVAILVECPGMAPEEVEQLVTFPIETAVNGAAGSSAARRASFCSVPASSML